MRSSATDSGRAQPPHQDKRATMAGEMQLFTQKIGDHSIAINAMQVGGAPWIRGNDVAAALGYTNPRKAIRDHVDQEDRQTLEYLRRNDSFRPPEHNEGAQVFINESGLYTLIMRSKKAEAKLFQRWVTNEVLPSIRQTGQYNAQQPRAESGRSSAPELDAVCTARMRTLSVAYRLAQDIDSTSQARLRLEAQRAIDDVLLPTGDSMSDYVDAADILRERAYTEEQIARLAGELGKALKLVSSSEGRAAQSSEQEFGPDRRQVGLYHRARDAKMIEDVLAPFRQRELHARVMAGLPDPTAARRAALLNSQGRGRSRS